MVVSVDNTTSPLVLSGSFLMIDGQRLDDDDTSLLSWLLSVTSVMQSASLDHSLMSPAQHLSFSR